MTSQHQYSHHLMYSSFKVHFVLDYVKLRVLTITQVKGLLDLPKTRDFSCLYQSMMYIKDIMYPQRFKC